MPERIILHIDMDAFFAAIEVRNNPQFSGKPVVVGADPKGGAGRGVVSTANYVARKYGIYSALPISKAYQLCPNAIFLPVDMALYQKVSENIMEICKKYSSQIEQVSLDEAYLDISFAGTHDKAMAFAENLKKEIIEKEKLTGTIGIGPNKLIAKIASEKGKPDGLLIIKPKDSDKFLEPLDIEDLPGIGPKTAEIMRHLGINKIADLKSKPEEELRNIFGKAGEYFYKRARGIDKDPLTPDREAKSISKEYTFERDTRDSEIIFHAVDELIKDVYDQAIENGFSFRTITARCRFSGFETHTKAKTFKKPVGDFNVFKKEAKILFLRFFLENPKLVRLVGVKISSLS